MAQDHGGNAVATDSASRAHVTGNVQTKAVFGLGSATQFQPTAGAGDIFLITYAAGTPREVFYVSSSSGGSVDGIGFADEDVLAYDPVNNAWSMLIDGSDIGLGATDIDGFEWSPDGMQLLSFNTPVTLPGMPFPVDDSDIVRFIPSRLGATTEGRFEFFFDGSDVGLDSDGEDIDAVGICSDGKLVVSTEGPARVPGVSGELATQEADLLLFSGGGFGEATRGTWTHLFEGVESRLGDQAGEGLRALWFPPDDAFVISPGDVIGTLSNQNPMGDGAEAWRCQPFDSGAGLQCGYFPFFDGAAKGMRGESIDAFGVGEAGVLGDIGDGDDTEAGLDEDPVEAPDEQQRIFLPLIRR